MAENDRFIHFNKITNKYIILQLATHNKLFIFYILLRYDDGKHHDIVVNLEK